MTDLLTALQQPATYPHPTNNIRLLETHCSWVLLTGDYAYKIKKPVNFGFLDYSDLEKRQHFCHEELKRNQLLASEVYLEVVTIHQDENGINLTGSGDIIEYTVKMREFGQDNILSQLQARHALNETIIKKLAVNLAKFHQHCETVTETTDIGSSEHAHQQTTDNFNQTLPLLSEQEDIDELNSVQAITDTVYGKVKTIIDQRKHNGFVRKCHGDVHLNNIVLINDEPIIFDCIDFNNDFCWTDTMADLGFITMDLNEFNEPQLSNSLLNQYLQYSGDYQGLFVLPYFQAYRAMVRAKVAMFRLQQELSPDEHQETRQRYKNCVAASRHYLQSKPPVLIITCGVSASGKTTIAKTLANRLTLIHLVSDIERKRQADIQLNADCTDDVLQGLYSPEQTVKTYQRLLELSRECLQAGYSTIVDATFRDAAQRQAFARLATELKLPFIIIHCATPEPTLRQRLNERQQQSSKLSEATQDVLSMQLEKFAPLTSQELPHHLKIDNSKPLEFATMQAVFNELIAQQMEGLSEIS